MRVATAVFLLAMMLPGQQCNAPGSSALAFDGIGAWAQVPDHPALDGFGDFTIELWLRSPSPPAQNAARILYKAISSSGSPDDAYGLAIDTAGRVRVELYSQSFAIHTGARSVADGLWHHVAVSRSGSTVHLFIDGAIDLSFQFGDQLLDSDPPLTIGTLLSVGAGGPLPGGFLLGSIDEVRIWNVARGQGDLVQHMLQPLTGLECGLVGYWRFDEGSGQTIEDCSTSGADGFLGATMVAESSDPSWIVGHTPPVPYLLMSQPTGPGSLLVDALGVPGETYFTAFSFETMNATSVGTGPWFGLHIAAADVLEQLAFGAPPFIGTLDSAGRGTFALSAGTLPAWYPVVWGVTITAPPSLSQITGVSKIASLDVQ